MEKLLHATPVISCGVAGVSSDGHPAVEVVDLMPQRSPPQLHQDQLQLPITGRMSGSHPMPQTTGITGNTPWGSTDAPEHLEGRGSCGPWPHHGPCACGRVCVCVFDGAVTLQLSQGKVGAGSTPSK